MLRQAGLTDVRYIAAGLRIVAFASAAEEAVFVVCLPCPPFLLRPFRFQFAGLIFEECGFVN